MTSQRNISLNPEAHRFEAIKITYPPAHSRRRGWVIEAMKFIPHDGTAKE